VHIKVVVTAGAKKDLIEDLGDDAFRVNVRAKAQNNAANFSVVELLAEYFSVPTSVVKITRGHRAKTKFIRIG